MPLKKEDKLSCPGCAKQRGPSQLKRVLFNASYQTDFAWLKANPQRWACDLCLRDGGAVIANPKKQVFGLGSPYLAFIRRKCTCSACGKEFIFSAKEQKFWYEKLQFHLDSEPIRCATCRREYRKHRNINSQLSELLQNKATMTAADWLSVAEIYNKIGNQEKSKYAYSQAKKLTKK